MEALSDTIAAMAEVKDTYRTVTPYLVVPNADAELAFLKAAFGGTEVMCQRHADNTVMHAEVAIGDSLIMLGQAGGQWTARPSALYLWVGDVDATYAKALAAGATSESEPEDKPYGHRNAGVVDQNGITWWIGAPVR
jgi:PhnB protein